MSLTFQQRSIASFIKNHIFFWGSPKFQTNCQSHSDHKTRIFNAEKESWHLSFMLHFYCIFFARYSPTTDNCIMPSHYFFQVSSSPLLPHLPFLLPYASFLNFSNHVFLRKVMFPSFLKIQSFQEDLLYCTQSHSFLSEEEIREGNRK